MGKQKINKILIVVKIMIMRREEEEEIINIDLKWPHEVELCI